MIFAIAALSLDLILGFGGLVSFGHAAFIGIGAYATGIMITEARTEALLILPVAARRLRRVRAVTGRGLAAHARRRLHHDHARLRADGVLPGAGALGLWRR